MTFKYGSEETIRHPAPEHRRPRLEDAGLMQRMEAARKLCRQTPSLDERWRLFALALFTATPYHRPPGEPELEQRVSQRMAQWASAASACAVASAT